MIASLPMYAAPRVAAANAYLWGLIRDRLRAAGHAAPDRLTLTGDIWQHWQSADLVLSQTCSLPYRARLQGQVTLVGTPDYGLPGCAPGYYFSVIVARSDNPLTSLRDFAGRRFAFNDALSQSGWAALANETPEVLTGSLLETGSHRASAYAVRDAYADFAAIDAVTWRHLTAASEAVGLKVIHQTAPTPGLPFITAAGADATALCDAITASLRALPRNLAEKLQITGLAQIATRVYRDQAMPPAPGDLGQLQ